MNQETLLKIINWATGDDTGVSSKALCRFMLGLDATRRFGAPSDADDRGRCIRLLNLIPEWWDRLDEMASLPSSKVTYFIGKEFQIREEGWKEQIPLIKKEASDLLPFEHGEESPPYACKEMMDKHAGKTVCCGCVNHKCQPAEEQEEGKE